MSTTQLWIAIATFVVVAGAGTCAVVYLRLVRPAVLAKLQPFIYFALFGLFGYHGLSSEPTAFSPVVLLSSALFFTVAVQWLVSRKTGQNRFYLWMLLLFVSIFCLELAAWNAGTFQKRRLSVSNTGVIHNRADGVVEEVRWANLQVVYVTTARQGVFIHLRDSEGACAIPNDGTAKVQALCARLRQLPGFDNEVFDKALKAERAGEYLCWRSPAE